MRPLWPILKKYRVFCVLAPLFKMLEALFDLYVPLIVADIINRGVGTGDTGYILGRCALLVALAAVGLSCAVAAQYFSARTAVGPAGALRRQVYAHIQSLGYPELEGLGVSTLITRMTNDIQQVQNGVNLFLRLFLRSPFIVFGALIMALRINRPVSMVFIGVVAALSVVVFGIMKKTRPMFTQIQKEMDGVNGTVQENLTGVRVVRAFRQEENEKDRAAAAMRALKTAQLKAGRISSLMNPMTYALVNLGLILILYIGAGQADAGLILRGEVVALTNYLSQILVELIKLANLIVQLARAYACAGRVEKILSSRGSMTYPDASAPMPQTDEAIAFERVSFTYPGSRSPALSGLDFTVGKGETLGIIGGTGSGKTSLIQVMCRFYDADEGQVRLFGVPVKDLTREDLRALTAVVPQQARLFRGTVRSNLLWGSPDATDAVMDEALRTAQAADFVYAKTGGLDAVVEQNGENFSGGQRQRLAVARALTRHAPILILDDAASALDYVTEARMRKALRELKDTTVVIISQRVASLRHADRILVLDDGRLVGQGRHEELLGTCPVYREICESQRKEAAR